MRANGYRTFIATGGSSSFVSEYSDEVYGIPPEQVAGTAQAIKYGYDEGLPVLEALGPDSRPPAYIEGVRPTADRPGQIRPRACLGIRNSGWPLHDASALVRTHTQRSAV
jgi:hypothetical protein